MSRSTTVLGYYDFRNSGDEAFKEAFAVMLPDRKLRFTNEIGDAEDLSEADLILGAGDLIDKYYLGKIPVGQPFDAIGVGLPFGEASLNALEPHRNNIGRLYLRNRIDADYAVGRGFDAYYTPDIVLSLDPCSQPVDLGFERQHRKLCVIFLSDHFNASFELQKLKKNYYSEYMKLELAEVISVIARHNDVLMVPLSFDPMHPDVRISFDVLMQCAPDRRSSIHVMERELNTQEVLSVLSQATSAMAMKYHGLIYSILSGVPVVNIGYTRKSQVLMHELGLESLNVLPYAIEKERLLAAIKIAESGEAAKAVARVRDEKKSELEDVAAALRSGG